MPSGEAKAKKTGKASKTVTQEAEQNVPETAAPGTPDKDDKDKDDKDKNGIVQVTEELPVYLL